MKVNIQTVILLMRKLLDRPKAVSFNSQPEQRNWESQSLESKKFKGKLSICLRLQRKIKKFISLSKGRLERKYDRREILIHAGLCVTIKGNVCVAKKMQDQIIWET